MVPVTLTGVYPVGPESFLCALLHWEEKNRFIPVWLPPLEGTQLMARLNGWTPTRPSTQDLLADVVTQSTSGVQAIEISGYLQGTFMATVTLEDGTELDARASDALGLALILDVAVEVDETVAAQTAMWLSAADAQQYFDLDLSPGTGEGGAGPGGEGPSASGDAEADAAFEQLMRDLGVDEDELTDPEGDGRGDEG